MDYEEMLTLWLYRRARQALDFMRTSIFFDCVGSLLAFMLTDEIFFILLGSVLACAWIIADPYFKEVDDYLYVLELSQLSFEELRKKIDDDFVRASRVRNNPEEYEACMHERQLAWLARERKFQR